MATEILIEKLIQDKKATFERINIVKTVSRDLADKLTILNDYHKKTSRPYADRSTKETIVEFAKENNLFDQPVYTIYKQVNEVFEKLPFLDYMLGVMYFTQGKEDSPLVKALTDLFKYHKHRVNLENYTLKLTEDAPLEEVLTQDTITELETI